MNHFQQLEVNHPFRALLLAAFQCGFEEFFQVFDLAILIVLQQIEGYLTITPENLRRYARSHILLLGSEMKDFAGLIDLGRQVAYNVSGFSATLGIESVTIGIQLRLTS